MPASPEREYPITEFPENPTVPADVGEQTGMSVSVPQPPAKVMQGGQVVVQSVDSQGVSVQIPAEGQAQLAMQAKGDAKRSATWWAVELLRRIKMAIFNGISVVFVGRKRTDANS